MATQLVGGRPPPAARRLPVVGSLPFVLANPFEMVLEARRSYGDAYTLDLGFTNVIMLCHPRHAQRVLRDNAAAYDKGGPFWQSMRALVGNGLIVSEGEFWRRQRRMMQPHFSRDRLTVLTEQIARSRPERQRRWDLLAESGTPLDMVAELSSTMMNLNTMTLFGTGISVSEAAAISANVEYIFEFMVPGMAYHRLPQWMPVPGRRRYERAVRELDEAIARIIDQHRRGGESRAGFMSTLADTIDAETGARMTAREVRDEAVTFFLAGYETTAMTLSWAAHSLVHHPECADALRAELDAVVADREPAVTDLPRLKYLHSFLCEVTRLYPVAYWIPRRATEEDVIDGWTIPKGAMLALVTYAIQRHPELWPDPERFDPTRFSPERASGRHPLSWMPFGAGQRLCIGKDFALVAGQLVLAELAQRYDLEAVPGRPMSTPVLSMTLRPKHGVWVYLKKRTARRASQPSLSGESPTNEPPPPAAAACPHLRDR